MAIALTTCRLGSCFIAHHGTKWQAGSTAIREPASADGSKKSIGQLSRNATGGMSMTIQSSTRLVNGVAIVDISGQLRLGEGTGRLREVVQQLAQDGYRKILLNLAGVTHIDSSGIGELMMNYTTLRNQGGELKLMNLNKNVHNLLQITRLFTVFDVHDDQASALKSFG
jgi:anti-sigma B factor antagonist